MKSASGLLYRKGEFIEAHAIAESGIINISEGALENPDITGIIMPRPVNCHTHLGDAFIQPPESATVEELVAPPKGLKHRMLAEVDIDLLIEAMTGAARTMAASSVSHFIDFREGGIQGASALLLSVIGTGLQPVVMGRPAGKYDAEEMESLLSVADGIGLSAISDIEPDELQNIVSHVKKAGKALGLHASEAVQENRDVYLDLDPDFLVHMVKADAYDLAACSGAGVPVIVCPSANDYFGLKPPIRQMLDAGITVSLGTDNAMLSSPDIFREMRFLKDHFELELNEIFTIVFENSRKVLNSLPGLRAANGEDYFVLEAALNDPWEAVIGAKPDRIRLFDNPE